MEVNFKTRNIAITDVETTGLDSSVHEVIEIGLVVVNQPHFEVVDTLELKIKPTHIETAEAMALKVNGYTADSWQDAVTLSEAMVLYAQKTQGAIFCSHSVTFDYSFIKEAFRTTKVTNTMDYHVLDIPTMVWMKYRESSLERLNLNKVAAFLGIPPEPEVHRAINGAMTALNIIKKLSLN
ncbi:MAG TPA: 3'-5' exonuclease [Candidatus Saccharimonadales bacterium]|nr:3'-5' exonuclease [Candidatus Saccharimonadales bacterium]